MGRGVLSVLPSFSPGLVGGRRRCRRRCRRRAVAPVTRCGPTSGRPAVLLAAYVTQKTPTLSGRGSH